MFAEPLEVQLVGERGDLPHHRLVDRHGTGKRQSNAMPAEDPAWAHSLRSSIAPTTRRKRLPEVAPVLKVVPQSIRYDIDVFDEVRSVIHNRGNDRIVQQSDKRSHTCVI